MAASDVPVTEIARQMGVTERTISTWIKTAEAKGHIAAIRASVREATKHMAIANKVRRINYAQQMRDGIDAVIAARRVAGEAKQFRTLPGEGTGHVAVKETTNARGDEIREAAFDASLHNEARKWNEYAAKELGELETGINVKHSGRVDHVVRRFDFSNLSDEQLEALAEIREQALAEEATA